MHANNIITLLDAEHAAIASIGAGATLAAALGTLMRAAQSTADDGTLACILMLDDADCFISLVAPDFPADYAAVLLACATGPGTSPFGAAAFSGAPVFSSDIAQDQAWTDGRKAALLHGFRACWAAPVFGANGHILGVLGLMFHASKHPTQIDTELMTVTTRACAHLIEHCQAAGGAATVLGFGQLEQGVPTLRFENRYRHRDGAYRWMAWTAAGSQGLIHAIGRDVTDEKEARLALARSEQALLQSQKLESIGKLTGGVAHDFNNVLQIISGNLQLLQLAVGANPVAMKRVETSIAAVERGAKLSSQLLAFARRQPLKPLVTDLGRLVRSTAELFRRAIGEMIETDIIAGPGLWHALIDPNQLENVLLNLAINARDAMDRQGRLTVELDNATLDAGQAEEPGQYVRLAITDTGHGMQQDVLDKIFEPFFSTKKEGEGSGLGLSMAYGFIKQSGGHIKVYSQPGQGSTFEIYLPRTLEPLADLRVTLSGPVVGGNETILVVEDDVHVQTAVFDMLRGLGYAVLKANTALSALAVVKSGVAIDLLFTDVVMPGELRSPEMVRQAKLLLPDMAVLFTSGYTQNAIMQGGRLDPGVELLSKPYRREDLARKVRQILARRQADMAAAAAGNAV